MIYLYKMNSNFTKIINISFDDKKPNVYKEIIKNNFSNDFKVFVDEGNKNYSE